MAPLYDYECQNKSCGNIDERFYRMSNIPKKTKCSRCGGLATRIFLPGHGGIQTDTPKWLDESVRGALEGDNEKPIRTRKDLAQKLKEIGAEPVEKGHRNLRMI